jgi:tetratricopeptide (TPR) repeat protein
MVLLALNTYWGAVKAIAFRHRQRGALALASADLNQAYLSLRAAVAWQPSDAQSHVLIGRTIQLAQANGLPIEAIEGHEPIERLGIGVAAVAQGIALNPADPWGWFILGDLYQGFRAGKLRLEMMKRAGEAAGVREGADPAPQAPAGAAAAPAGLGPEDAVTMAADIKALDLEPNYFFHHDYLANLYFDRGLREDAAREIRKSMALWPRVEAHPILEDMVLIRELVEPILEGIDLSASSPYAGPAMAARARGRIMERLGRIEEAIAAFEELRRVGDEEISAECDLDLGMLEQRQGRYKESLPYLERVARTAPSGPQGIWAPYYMGLAYSRLGDSGKAIELLRTHLELAPGSLAGYMDLAGELERVGQSAEAERLYIAAVRRFPDNPATYLRTIEQMRRHGRAKQALAYAQAYRKVSSDYEGAERLIFELSAEAAPRAP